MFIVQRFLARRKIRRELARLKSKTKKKETINDSQETAVEHLIGPALVNDESKKKLAKWRKSTVERLHLIQTINLEIAEIRQKLGEHNLRALKLTWKMMMGTTGLRKPIDLMVYVFEETVKIEPQTKCLMTSVAFLRSFQKNAGAPSTMRRHAQQMANLLDFLISDKIGFQPHLVPQNIGENHASLNETGFNCNVWESFGRCLADIITRQDPVRACPNGGHAWNMLSSLLTDYFRIGFERKVKHKKELSSLSNKLISSKSTRNCSQIASTSHFVKSKTIPCMKEVLTCDSSPLNTQLTPESTNSGNVTASESQQPIQITAQERRRRFITSSSAQILSKETPTNIERRIRSNSCCQKEPMIQRKSLNMSKMRRSLTVNSQLTFKLASSSSSESIAYFSTSSSLCIVDVLPPKTDVQLRQCLPISYCVKAVSQQILIGMMDDRLDTVVQYI